MKTETFKLYSRAFEYLCRMSSKLSYTVSKLMGFSETQCLLNAERFFQSAATGGRVEIGPRSPKSMQH